MDFKKVQELVVIFSLFCSGFPSWLSGKESACQCRRRRFSLSVGKIPWRRRWQPTPVFLPENPMDRGAWRAAVQRVGRDLATKQQLFCNVFFYPLATHSSILAWKIPWTEEPGRPQSIGSQRVGHN